MSTRSLSLVLTLLCALLILVTPVAAQQACTPQSTLKTSIALAWTAPVQPANVTTIGYTFERQVDNGPWLKLVDLPLTPLTYVDRDLAPNHTYSYRLVAQGKMSDGSTGVSGYASHGVPPPCISITVISAPSNLTATPQ